MDTLLRRRLMMLGGGGPTPPPAPQPVFYEKLVFDGTAYIETDIVLPEDCSFMCQIGGETLKAAQQVYRAEGGDGKTLFSYGGNTNNTNRQFVCYYDSSSYLSPANKTLAFSYSSFWWHQTPKGFGNGNNFYSYTKGNLHPTGHLCIGYGLNGTGQPFTGWMDGLRIYGSDAQNAQGVTALNQYTPVYILRPCLYGGEAGLWNVQTNTFYGNSAGAGSLAVAGNIINP